MKRQVTLGLFLVLANLLFLPLARPAITTTACPLDPAQSGHYYWGLIGAKVMGQGVARNGSGNGFSVVVYDPQNPKETQTFVNTYRDTSHDIGFAPTLAEFVKSLKRPRKILMLLKDGKPIDDALTQIIPFLEQGDVIIDSANSHYSDTTRRYLRLARLGIDYIGMGISGGEEGALHGPSLMPAGTPEAYAKVSDLLIAMAAKTNDGERAIFNFGPNAGAGHFVKMVHNGIEYAEMQSIAEVYDLLRRTLGFTAKDFEALFTEWNKTELQSFLINATSKVFGTIDPLTGKYYVDKIVDQAGSKGTGKWTAELALNLGVSIPTLLASLDARFISSERAMRQELAPHLIGPTPKLPDGMTREKVIGIAKNALYASKILFYSEGLYLMKMASDEFGYGLDLGSVARTWRAGCILQGRLVEEIAEAYGRNPQLKHLLYDPAFQGKLAKTQADLREFSILAIQTGVPVPAASMSIAYYDAIRSAELPTNLIQALRDKFGAHMVQLVTAMEAGLQHLQWNP